jgi:hypothetical protein
MTSRCRTYCVCLMGNQAICRTNGCPPTVNSSRTATGLFKTNEQMENGRIIGSFKETGR